MARLHAWPSLVRVPSRRLLHSAHTDVLRDVRTYGNERYKTAHLDMVVTVSRYRHKTCPPNSTEAAELASKPSRGGLKGRLIGLHIVHA